MTEALGAAKGERAEGRLDCRSGHYRRALVTRIGKIELRVPQDRQGRRGGGVYPLVGPERASGGRGQSLPLHLFQECHVEVAVILLPPLVLLNGDDCSKPEQQRTPYRAIQ